MTTAAAPSATAGTPVVAVPPAAPALGIIDHEPADQYHATQAVSFHRLMTFDPAAGGHPALFYYRHVLGHQQPETKALHIGRATHAFVLEGEATFQQEFVVAPAGMKGTSKEYHEWKKALETGLDAGKSIVAASDFHDIQMMALSVRSKKSITNILKAGKPEVTIRCIDPDTQLIKQARFDWLDLDRAPAAALDLKKTARPLEDFPGQSRGYNYDRQITWYARLLAEALNDAKSHLPWTACADIAGSMVNAVVEDFPSWRAEGFSYDSHTLEVCDAMNTRALHQLYTCSLNNSWPDMTGETPICISTRS